MCSCYSLNLFLSYLLAEAESFDSEMVKIETKSMCMLKEQISMLCVTSTLASDADIVSSRAM